jgi:Protein of unknown function (DUF3309)
MLRIAGTLSHKGRGEAENRFSLHQPDPRDVALSGSSNGTIVRDMLCSGGGAADFIRWPLLGEGAMSLGLILVIILIIFLLGGFSGRFGGYGYGMGHSGMGLGGVILVVLLILLLLGKL